MHEKPLKSLPDLHAQPPPPLNNTAPHTPRAALAVTGLLPAMWLRVVHLRPLRLFFPLPFALPLPSPLRTRAAAVLAI